MERELRHDAEAKWHQGRVASSGAVLTNGWLGGKETHSSNGGAHEGY
jgi:hypothetical protein